MTLKEIQNKWDDGCYRNLDIYPSLFPLHYAFDKEKSVKWNEEEVCRRNETIREQRREYQIKDQNLQACFKLDVMNWLYDEYNFTTV